MEKKDSANKVSTKRVSQKHVPHAFKLLAIVRIRGLRGVRHSAERTLNQIGGGGLHRKHGCVLVADTPSIRGMLQEAKDYITWGDASLTLVEKLFEKRGDTISGKPLSSEISKTGFASVKELGKAVFEGTLSIKQLREKGVRDVFTLQPPKKGFEGPLKQAYQEGGALGERKEKISQLIERMI